jgi:sn-glycerol 3-phosphate transport system ATP-binding protein
MVFQNYALYPHMTVEKNLAFGLRQRRTSREDVGRRVDEVSRMLGLEELLQRRPGQLSGGQRQRVAMGRALVREPDVFLLDEPLSNLDAKLRVQMRSELKRLQGRLGVTTIYVTHDQVEAITLGERIAVLSDGVLQQVGPPQEVYDNPDNVFVASFIGSPPMNLLKGSATSGRVAVGDLVFDHPRVPNGDVLVGIRPEGLRPVGGDHAGSGLELRVEVIEPLGDEVLVHGSVEARDAGMRLGAEATLLADTDTDRGVVTVRLPPEERPEAGSRLLVAPAPGAIRLFDATSGLAIRPD